MTEQQPASAAVRLPPGEYQIDPAQTTIRFTTRHMFGLAPVTGQFDITAGTIHISEPVEESRADISIATASFHTGNTRRDSDVKGPRFLHAEKRPVITVRIDRTERAGEAIIGYGTLDAGTRPAPITVEITGLDTSGPDIRGHATARVDRYAHGLTAARGMAGRHLTLTLDLTITAIPGRR